MIHTILDFDLMCIFQFVFKRTLTSLKFFFCLFKAHIFDLIHFVLIKIRFNIFMWSFLITYFLVFLQEDFIHWNVNNSIIILLPVKYIYVCGIVLVVLIRNDFSILITKVSQGLAFIWWMIRDMDETSGFGLTLRIVYISFPALARDLNCLGGIIWWGGLSSL